MQPVRLPRNLFSPVLQDTRGGLRFKWILTLPPHSPPSFPPFLFWSRNCLLWLLSTTCVCFDHYFLPVHVQEGDPILPFQNSAQLSTREALSDFLSFRLGWICQCLFHKITSSWLSFSYLQTWVLRTTWHTYIPKVALHPLNDINASDSILKYVNLQEKNVGAGSYEKLSLDEKPKKTQDHMLL
jgi:hypothetical protein